MRKIVFDQVVDLTQTIGEINGKLTTLEVMEPVLSVNGLFPDTNGNVEITTGGGGAPLDSPAFTGIPTAPTATKGTSTTQLATTAFVGAALADYVLTSSLNMALAMKADLNSPVFTGVPAAPTATKGTSTTQLATTSFVATALGDYTPTTSINSSLALKANINSPSFTGTPYAPNPALGTTTSQIATCNFVYNTVTPMKGLSGFYGGKLQPNAVMMAAISPYDFIASPPFSSCRSTVAATNATEIILNKNGTLMCKITFSAGGTVGTVLFYSTAIVAGDFITVHAPDNTDATLENITLLIRAN